jgi:membrane protein DedA with SNARE-associated domain
VPSWLEGKPFAITFTVLFVIVLLRAQATYWIARGVTAGVLHTKWANKVTGPRTTGAITALNRWGLPLVTISFLTIGLQTVVNAAAGLIRMPWIRYTIAMLIGCVAWALIYATVGIAAVEASVALTARSPWALIGALAVVVGVVVTIVVRRRNRAGTDRPSTDARETDARRP